MRRAADANILINTCRLSAQRYTFAYQEPIPVEQLVRNLCDTKQASPNRPPCDICVSFLCFYSQGKCEPFVFLVHRLLPTHLCCAWTLARQAQLPCHHLGTTRETETQIQFTTGIHTVRWPEAIRRLSALCGMVSTQPSHPGRVT